MLTKSELQAWFTLLPEDIQQAIEGDYPADDEQAKALAEAVLTADFTAIEIVLEANADAVAALGRIGRVRLLAYLSGQVLVNEGEISNRLRALHLLLNGEDETGGKSATQIMLLEDIKAFNEAVSKRIYERTMDYDSIEIVKQATIDVSSVPTL